MARKPNYTKDGQGKGIMPADEGHHAQKLIIPQTAGKLVSADEDEFATGNEGLSADSMLIPRLALLEGLSPQLKPRASEFIPNAHIGQICDVTFGDVWDDIYIIPCVFRNIYIKWAPRNSGEGMLEYYGSDPTEYNKLPANNKMKHLDKDGNEIVKHGTIYCINLSAGERLSFLPMASTRYKAAQQFNNLRSEEKARNPHTGEIELLKMCSRIYHVTVGERTKGDNSWHIPQFAKAVKTKEYDPTGRLWTRALTFTKQVESGLVQGDFARDDEEEGTSREHAAM